MNQTRYDLEERTYTFAQAVHVYCKNFMKIHNLSEYTQQVIRSSSSIGANYIEANESLGKKDFLMRVIICLKESKETAYWLRLLIAMNDVADKSPGLLLLREATELKKIFGAIAAKSK